MWLNLQILLVLLLIQFINLLKTHVFIPIAVESMGAVGDDGLSFLRELGARIMHVSKEPRSFELLMQRFSVAIQRGMSSRCRGSVLPSNVERVPDAEGQCCHPTWKRCVHFRNNA